MANIKVQTAASGTGTIGGAARHRGEQLQHFHGKIAAADYASADVISFAIQHAGIVHAHFQAQGSPKVDLFVFRGTSLASSLAFAVGSVKVDIHYHIVYRRGSGGGNLRITPTVA